VQLAGPIGVAADITPLAAAHLKLAPGQPIWVAVKATETASIRRPRHRSKATTLHRNDWPSQFPFVPFEPVR